MYVANKNSNSISVISTATNKVVQTKSSVTGPTGLAVSGGKLYVTQQGNNLNRVLVLNSSTLAQIATINMAGGADVGGGDPRRRPGLCDDDQSPFQVNEYPNQCRGLHHGGQLGFWHRRACSWRWTAQATNGKVYITDAVEQQSCECCRSTRGNTAPVGHRPVQASIDSTTRRPRRSHRIAECQGLGRRSAHLYYADRTDQGFGQLRHGRRHIHIHADPGRT